MHNNMILVHHKTGLALCGLIPPTSGIHLRLPYTVGTAAASELVSLILGAFHNPALRILESPLRRAPHLLKEYSLYLGELQGTTPSSTNFLAAEQAAVKSLRQRICMAGYVATDAEAIFMNTGFTNDEGKKRMNAILAGYGMRLLEDHHR